MKDTIMDLKLPSSEDTFDKAVKTLQLSDLGRESQNVMQFESSDNGSSDYSNAPDVVKNNKGLYDKIFKEVLIAMKEEEECGLLPAFSDMFNSSFSQITYSQFVKGVTKASTQNEFERNEQYLLNEQHENCLLSNKLYPKVDIADDTLGLKDDKKVHLSNAKLYRNIEDESVIPSCSKINFFVERTNRNKNAGVLAKDFVRNNVNICQSSSQFSTDVSCDAEGKSGSRNFKIVSIQNSLVHSNMVLAKNCRAQETNYKTTTDRHMINYNRSNSGIVSDKICTSYVDQLSDTLYSNKTIAKADGMFQEQNKEHAPIPVKYDSKVTGDLKYKFFEGIPYISQNTASVVNSELRVVVDTPFVEKYTPLDILERKLIEFYNKRTSQNIICKLQKSNRVRKQKTKDSPVIKPMHENYVKRTNIDSAKVVKSHVKSGLQLENYEITDIPESNVMNYDIQEKYKNHSGCRIQLRGSFCKLNEGSTEVGVPVKFGTDSSTIMHLMYDALQVGCVKSSGFVRSVAPSIQNDAREDAVRFYCKSCLSEYSYQDVKSTFNSDSLTCFCPKELHLGLYNVLVAEFSFKLLVEDLSKCSFTYILAGKEAEIFFGCTVYDFWHSIDSRRVVRRSVRNLLRSYKRRILSEFCLSTRNLFGPGPKYLVNVSRETCIAPL